MFWIYVYTFSKQKNCPQLKGCLQLLVNKKRVISAKYIGQQAKYFTMSAGTLQNWAQLWLFVRVDSHVPTKTIHYNKAINSG